MKLSIIVARNKNKAIGIDGKLPWGRHERDMRFFRSKTQNSILLMGSETYLSLPNVLEGRRLVVITKSKDKGGVIKSRMIERGEHNSIVVVNYDNTDVETLLSRIQKLLGDDVDHMFVAGGAKVYQEFLPHCDTVYLSEIRDSHLGDTFFEFDETEWKVTEKNIFADVTFYELHRK